MTDRRSPIPWEDRQPLTATLTRAEWKFLQSLLRSKYYEDVYAQNLAAGLAHQVMEILNRNGGRS